MTSKFLIYGLRDPRTNEIRYVGRSSSGMRRPRRHDKAASLKEDNYKSRWVSKLLALGLSFEIVVLERVSDGSELDQAERKWISIGRSALGSRLTNLTSGGQAGSFGTVQPEASRKATSKRFKGIPLTEEHKAKLRGPRGKRTDPVTDEHRYNLSKAKLGKKLSNQHIKNLSESHKGLYRPLEVSKKQGSSLKKFWADPVNRADMLEARQSAKRARKGAQLTNTA